MQLDIHSAVICFSTRPACSQRKTGGRHRGHGQGMNRTDSYLATLMLHPLAASPSRRDSRSDVSPPASQSALSWGSCSVIASRGSSTSSRLLSAPARCSGPSSLRCQRRSSNSRAKARPVSPRISGLCCRDQLRTAATLRSSIKTMCRKPGNQIQMHTGSRQAGFAALQR